MQLEFNMLNVLLAEQPSSLAAAQELQTTPQGLHTHTAADICNSTKQASHERVAM
jgi:hypothetical protein